MRETDMYGAMVDNFDKLIAERDSRGISPEEPHEINEEIKECMDYLNKHL